LQVCKLNIMCVCVCVCVCVGWWVGFEACKLPGYLCLSCGHRKKLYGSVLEVSRRLPTVYLLQTPVAYVNELKILVANQTYHVVVTNRHVTNKKISRRQGWGAWGGVHFEGCVHSIIQLGSFPRSHFG
jgi:hypothetical protein